jgi:hypothetical protein
MMEYIIEETNTDNPWDCVTDSSGIVDTKVKI